MPPITQAAAGGASILPPATDTRLQNPRNAISENSTDKEEEEGEITATEDSSTPSTLIAELEKASFEEASVDSGSGSTADNLEPEEISSEEISIDSHLGSSLDDPEVGEHPNEKTFPCPRAEKDLCRELFLTHLEASTHSILAHRGTSYHVTEDGKYVCLHEGCASTPESLKAMERHLKSFHSGIPFPCTLTGHLNCTEKYKNTRSLTAHIRDIHQQQRVPCLANSPDCKEDFKNRSMAIKHFDAVHGERCACPVAECPKEFFNIEAVQAHVTSVHEGLAFMCPLSEKLKCAIKFSSVLEAQKHAVRVHDPDLYLCPKEGCQERFDSRQSLRYHLDSFHQAKQIPCPHSEKYNCKMVFYSNRAATRHAASDHDEDRLICIVCRMSFATPPGLKDHIEVIHQGKRFKCLLAEELDCDQVFTSPGNAMRHTKRHTHPYLCRYEHCELRFATAKEERDHAYGDEHSPGSRWQCNVPNCGITVSGLNLQHFNTRNHHQKHIKHGHVDADTVFVPQEVPFTLPKSQLPLFRTILDYGGYDQTASLSRVPAKDKANSRTSLPGEEGIDNEEDGVTSNDDDREPDPEFDEFMDDEEFEAEFDEPKDDEGDDSPEAHRQRVYQNNVDTWMRITAQHEKCTANLSSLGLTCIGPWSLTQGLVSQPCPNGTKLDLDNTYLKDARRTLNRLCLAPRCAACAIMMRSMKWASKMKLLGPTQTVICTYKNCTRPTTQGLDACEQHIGFLPLQLKDTTGKNPEVELRKALKSAVRHQWTPHANYSCKAIWKRIQQIMKGDMPSSSLVVYDPEFSINSDQIWEISMVEVVSGKVLINTTVKHADLRHKKKGVPGLEMYSVRHAARVFNKQRNIDHMDMKQIAERLNKEGINSDTMILVWHASTYDLTLLKKFLQPLEHIVKLPPKENCIPLVWLFRHNLGRVGKSAFPTSLDILFPLMFPLHDLVGQNHEAKADCLQTRLMWMAFSELCRPIKERGLEWKPERVSRSSQRLISNYAHQADVVSQSSKKRKHGDTNQSDLDSVEVVDEAGPSSKKLKAN